MTAPRFDDAFNSPLPKVVANPTDTFVNTNPAADPLSRLAHSLSDVAPQLQRFSDIEFEKQKASDVDAGQAAARKAQESQLTYKDAIKQGVIRPDQSPWFQAAFQQQSGELAAERYRSELTMQVETKLQGEIDPAKFDALERETRKSFIDEQTGGSRDRFFEKGFGNIVDQEVAAAREQFATRAGAIMTQQSIDNLQQYTSELYANNRKSGLSPDVTAQQIAAQAAKLVQTNPLAGPKVNRAIAQAMVDAATNPNDLDPAALEVLGKIKGANGKSIAGISDVREMMSTAQREIGTLQYEQFTRQKAQDERKKTLETRGIFDEMIQAVSEDKHADIEPFAMRLAKIGADSDIEHLRKVSNVLKGNEFDSDRSVVDSLTVGIYTGEVTPAKLLNALAYQDPHTGQHILNNRDFRELWAMKHQKDKEDESSKGENWQRILTDPSLTRTLSNYKRAFGGNDLGGFDTAEHAAAYNAFANTIVKGWVDLRTGQGNVKPTADQLGKNLDWLDKNAREKAPTFLGQGMLGSLPTESFNSAPKAAMDTKTPLYQQHFYFGDEASLKGVEQRTNTRKLTDDDISVLQGMGVNVSDPVAIIQALQTQRLLLRKEHPGAKQTTP